MSPNRPKAAERGSEFDRCTARRKIHRSQKQSCAQRLALVLGSGFGAFADDLGGRSPNSLRKDPRISQLNGRGSRRNTGDRKSRERACRGDAGKSAFLRRILREGSCIPDARFSAAWDSLRQS